MRLKNKGNKPPAVVVGLSLTGLGTIRALAHVGIPVIAIDSCFTQPSAYTRHCRKVFCRDINDKDELIKTLISVAMKTLSRPVLFLSNDISVLIASENRRLLGNYYHINLPSKAVIRTFLDKALFSAFARQQGYQIPNTFIVEDIDALKSIESDIEYPCLIKPSFRTMTWDSATPLKVYKVFSKEELLTAYEKSASLAHTFVVQELIPGDDSEIYFCLLWFDSSSKYSVHFTGRKLMQWMPETGSTCIAESCINQVVLDKSVKLFKDSEYKGIGSVELKRDPRDNIFKIIEPTVGRADLQSAMAYHCGINIPLLEYAHMTSLQFNQRSNSKDNFCWVNEENLLWLLSSQGKRYSFSQWMSVARSKKRYALFDVKDIKPFLHFSIQTTRKLLAKYSSHYNTLG